MYRDIYIYIYDVHFLMSWNNQGYKRITQKNGIREKQWHETNQHSLTKTNWIWVRVVTRRRS